MRGLERRLDTGAMDYRRTTCQLCANSVGRRAERWVGHCIWMWCCEMVTVLWEIRRPGYE